MTPDPTTRDPAAMVTCECGAPCRKEVLMRGGDHGWGDDASRTVLRYVDDAPALLAEVERLRLRAAELEHQRDDYLSREWQATKAKAEAERKREAAEQVAREAVALLRKIRPALACEDTYNPCSDLRAAIDKFTAHHGARTGESNEA